MELHKLFKVDYELVFKTIEGKLHVGVKSLSRLGKKSALLNIKDTSIVDELNNCAERCFKSMIREGTIKLCSECNGTGEVSECYYCDKDAKICERNCSGILKCGVCKGNGFI